MEQVAQVVVEYVVTLIFERWKEVLLVLGVVTAWRWFLGHEFKKRIRRLEEGRSQAPVTINLAPGAIYNETKTNGTVHIHLSGTSEIVSPQPVRIIEASVGDEVGIGDNVDATLNPEDDD